MNEISKKAIRTAMDMNRLTKQMQMSIEKLTDDELSLLYGSLKLQIGLVEQVLSDRMKKTKEGYQ